MVKNSYDVALVVGTRPNFIKAAPLVKYFESNNLKVLFIHTGQHWDKNLSGNIFTDLELREPDINLETPLDGMNHQLSYMIKSLDTTLSKNSVPRVGVFGDVTSTLAAALVAKNRDLELFHVESGLRSRNMDMPEERNRLAVDTISDYLFTPSDDAVQNLLDENIQHEKIFNVGNIMIDTLKVNLDKILSSRTDVIDTLNINKELIKLKMEIKDVLKNKDYYELVNEGIRVVFKGRPNAGKSSIFNSILRKQKAIVSKTPGTTRDIIEGKINFKGNAITFYDTAGITITSDDVEKEGIKRTKKLLKEADIILNIAENEKFLSNTQNKKEWLILNKIDINKNLKKRLHHKVILISAKTGEGLQDLLDKISDEIIKRTKKVSSQKITITNLRQATELKEAELNILCLNMLFPLEAHQNP